MSSRTITVIAVDPGRTKCGIAVARRTGGAFERRIQVLRRAVIAAADLGPTVTELSSRFHPDAIVLGSGTSSADAARVIESVQNAPVVMVEERFSTQAARRRYFEENPPRGIWRLIPVSLQFPRRPYDDYAAIMLAEKYLLG